MGIAQVPRLIAKQASWPTEGVLFSGVVYFFDENRNTYTRQGCVL